MNRRFKLITSPIVFAFIVLPMTIVISVFAWVAIQWYEWDEIVRDSLDKK